MGAIPLDDGTVASQKDEQGNWCTHKSCSFRDYTTNCDPLASRTGALERINWLVIEPLGVEVNKSGHLHALFPTKKELMGVLLQSSHRFLAQVAQDM
jgi:hypothetical protein